MDGLSRRDSGKGKTTPGKKKKVDSGDFEEQLRDIIESSELSELDQFELPEEISSRLEKADLEQLESIERELMVNEAPLTGAQSAEVIEKTPQKIQQKIPIEEDKTSTELISDDLGLEKFDSSYDLDQIEPEPSSVKVGKPEDGRCEVKVSEDRMSAFIDLYPSEHGGRPLTSGYVLGRLKSAGVVYGINEELIKKLVKDIEHSKDIKRGVIIARGRLPEPGVDGSINYHFSSDDSVLKEM